MIDDTISEIHEHDYCVEITISQFVEKLNDCLDPFITFKIYRPPNLHHIDTKWKFEVVISLYNEYIKE